MESFGFHIEDLEGNQLTLKGIMHRVAAEDFAKDLLELLSDATNMLERVSLLDERGNILKIVD